VVELTLHKELLKLDSPSLLLIPLRQPGRHLPVLIIILDQMRFLGLDPHKILRINRVELQMVLDQSIVVLFEVTEQFLDHFHFVLLEFGEGLVFGQVLVGLVLFIDCGVVLRVAVHHVQAEDELSQLEVDVLVTRHLNVHLFEFGDVVHFALFEGLFHDPPLCHLVGVVLSDEIV
jgi:hypothetical protein